MRDIPSTLVERDQETAMPPGGGLAIVVVGSMLFWASLLWIVLR